MIVRNYFVLLVVLFCVNLSLEQVQVPVQKHEPVAFLEKPEDDIRRQNANNRKPYFIPGKCKDNELLFPGDQVDDWICDCTPGYIFHPPTDKCHPAFRQGPCTTGQYLILRKSTVLPECAPNPCVDGQVPIKNQCYELGKSNPCPRPELSYVLGVNTTTLEITCVKLSMTLANRFSDDYVDPIPLIDFETIPLCARGCKRYFKGTCPQQLESQV